MAVALCVLALGVTATAVRQAQTGDTPRRSFVAEEPPAPCPGRIPSKQRTPGTSSWSYPLAPAGAIEGDPSATSLRPGSTLGLHVSTRPGESYRVEVYRLGWYEGAGARLIRCLPDCAGDKKGTTQIVPAPVPAG